MKRIDSYIKSLGQAFKSTGEIAPWPIHVSVPSIYCGDYEALDLYSKMKKIAKNKNSNKIIAKLFDGPSVAKALLMDLIVGLKVAKPNIPAKERVWFINKMFDGIEIMQDGDIFCLDSRNIIYSSNRIQKLVTKTPWVWNNANNNQIIQSFYKTSAATKSLIWSLFFYGWDDVGYEIHGPYDVKVRNNQYQLVITDYFNLKPSLLWPKLKNFPYKSVKLMALYDKNINLSVDMFIHFVNEGNLFENTQAIYLETNKIPIKDNPSADKITKEILTQVNKQHQEIQNMSHKEIIKKYIYSRYYAFRKWRMYFNENWEPPKEVIKRVNDWDVIQIPSGKGPNWNELNKAFNPRTDYVPNE